MRFYRAIVACQQRLKEIVNEDVTSAARRTTSEVKGNHD
jgi:hypothetical protein